MTQFSTSDWVEVMRYTQFKFRGQFSNPVQQSSPVIQSSNPVQCLDNNLHSTTFSLQNITVTSFPGFPSPFPTFSIHVKLEVWNA